MAVTSIAWGPSSHPPRAIALSPSWILAVSCPQDSIRALGSGPQGPASPIHVPSASWPGILQPGPPRHHALRAHIFSSHMSCFRNILLSPACWHMSFRGKCSAILVAVVVLTRQIVTFPSHRWSLCKAAAGHALPCAMGRALQDPCKLEVECLFQLGGQPSLALGGLFWILANVMDSK